MCVFVLVLLTEHCLDWLKCIWLWLCCLFLLNCSPRASEHWTPICLCASLWKLCQKLSWLPVAAQRHHLSPLKIRACAQMHDDLLWILLLLFYWCVKVATTHSISRSTTVHSKYICSRSRHRWEEGGGGGGGGEKYMDVNSSTNTFGHESETNYRCKDTTKRAENLELIIETIRTKKLHWNRIYDRIGVELNTSFGCVVSLLCSRIGSRKIHRLRENEKKKKVARLLPQKFKIIVGESTSNCGIDDQEVPNGNFRFQKCIQALKWLRD